MSHDQDDHIYSAVDHDTWRRFFAAIERVWSDHHDLIHPYYSDHAHVLRRFKDHVPSLSEIKDLLRPIGWTALYVDGLAPPWEIAKLLDRRVMPVSRSIRPPEEIYFGNEPDLIHDMFGHLPLFMSAEYRKLLASWSYTASRVAINETDRANYHLNKLIVQSQDRVETHAFSHLKAAADGIDRFVARYPSASLLFDRTYFWIFEFGIVKQQGRMKILGAGLLSSLSEIEKIATQNVKTRLLDGDTILSPYNISTLQEGYLLAPTLQTYNDMIGDMVAQVALPKQQAERLYARG